MKTKAYIGTKIIRACPMTLGAYNNFRGWTIPEDEDPSKPGYLVHYPDGYKSWSPAETFDQCYREITFDEQVAVMSGPDYSPAAKKLADDIDRQVLDLDCFPIVGDVKITGGEKDETPLPFNDFDADNTTADGKGFDPDRWTG